jgi:hypothetical protein
VAVRNAMQVVRDSLQHDINHHIIDDVAKLDAARETL